MILETKMGRMQKSLETIYDEFIDGYLQGNFTEEYVIGTAMML